MLELLIEVTAAGPCAPDRLENLCSYIDPEGFDSSSKDPGVVGIPATAIAFPLGQVLQAELEDSDVSFRITSEGVFLFHQAELHQLRASSDTTDSGVLSVALDVFIEVTEQAGQLVQVHGCCTVDVCCAFVVPYQIRASSLVLSSPSKMSADTAWSRWQNSR